MKHTVSPEIIIFYKGEYAQGRISGLNYYTESRWQLCEWFNSAAISALQMLCIWISENSWRVFQNRAPGFAYTRIANPTGRSFERRVNELEGGIGGVACSSGMSAVTLSLLNILQAGDEVIAECIVRRYTGSASWSGGIRNQSTFIYRG